MRTVVVAAVLAIGLSVFGFSAALLYGQPESEGDSIAAIKRAHVAEYAFVAAWNDWAKDHEPFATNRQDKERFKEVRKRWKEFDRLCRAIEY